MKALFLDSESSGLPVFERRSNDPCQPHLCQVGARLLELDTGEVLDTLDMIVQQDGWRCSTEAMAVHKITKERSMLEGHPESVVAANFFAMVQHADVLLAYSFAFDRRMFRSAFQRHLDPLGTMVRHPPMVLRTSGNEKPKPAVTQCLPGDYVNSIPSQDVMQLVRPHVKTFSANGRAKAPKLTEAYEQLFGVPMPGAHDAMADVDGMIAVYWKVQQLEGLPVPANVVFPTATEGAPHADNH